MSDSSTADMYLGKISLKSIGINGTKVVKDFTDDNKTIVLAQIYGIAETSKEKRRVDESGEVSIDEPLFGKFEGVNLHTGEVFKSKVCYLPGALHMEILEQLKKGKDPIKFGVEIAALKMDNKSGFEYAAKYLYNTVPDSDPLGDLRKSVTTAKNASKPLAKKK